MTFCERFHLTPLEYAAQPADVILGWYRMAAIEGEERERQRKLDELRSGRRH